MFDICAGRQDKTAKKIIFSSGFQSKSWLMFSGGFLRVKSLTHGFLRSLSDWPELRHLILFMGSVFLEPWQESGSDWHPLAQNCLKTTEHSSVVLYLISASGYDRWECWETEPTHSGAHKPDCAAEFIRWSWLLKTFLTLNNTFRSVFDPVEIHTN